MPSSTCLPPLPYLCTGSIFSPKFLQPYSTSGTGLSLWVNKACVTSVSQNSAVCFSVRVSARTQQWVIKGKKTKRSEWTFVRYLWSGPLQAGRIFHICSAHYLQCFFFLSSVYVCAACVQHVCICNFPILLIPLPLCVRVLMCKYLPGEDSESNQQRTHFLSPRSLSPSPSYDLFSPCYESDPCGCYWEWVSEVLRLRLFMCLGWCVCVRACQSLCVSASEAKIHVIKRIASNILD